MWITWSSSYRLLSQTRLNQLGFSSLLDVLRISSRQSRRCSVSLNLLALRAACPVSAPCFSNGEMNQKLVCFYQMTQRPGPLYVSVRFHVFCLGSGYVSPALILTEKREPRLFHLSNGQKGFPLSNTERVETFVCTRKWEISLWPHSPSYKGEVKYLKTNRN